jgi:hypothetical protein
VCRHVMLGHQLGPLLVAVLSGHWSTRYVSFSAIIVSSGQATRVGRMARESINWFGCFCLRSSPAGVGAVAGVFVAHQELARAHLSRVVHLPLAQPQWRTAAETGLLLRLPDSDPPNQA